MSGNILTSVKLDYFILRSADLRRLTILAIVPLLAGTLSKDPLLVLGIMMTVSAFFMSSLFAIAEKNNLNKLYGVLPVAKRQTVIGRYIFTIACGVVMAAVGSILALGVSLGLQAPFDGATYVAWLSGSLLVFALLISVQFPLYFKYDFSKMAAFANLPYVVVIVIGAFLVRRYPELFAQAFAFFTRYPYMIWVLGLGGIVVLLGVSMAISVAVYEGREL